MASSSTSSYNSPCAACKLLRRKCMPGCVFAPYFPPEEPQKFVNVHKIFGASNVSKLLNDLLPHQREDAVNSLAYEAEARVRDPVYGCVGAISFLQRQVQRLQKELDAANADLIRYACSNHHNNNIPIPTPTSAITSVHQLPPLTTPARNTSSANHHQFINIIDGGGGGGGFYHLPAPAGVAAAAFPLPYSFPWSTADNSSGDHMNDGGGEEGSM